MNMKPLPVAFMLVLVISQAVLFSCTGTKNAVYFNNIQSTEIKGSLENLEPVIQTNDLLSIYVNSMNPSASELFNVSNPSNSRISNAAATSTVSPVIGYLVDQDGFVQLPFLGKVQAAGLTKKEFQEHVRRELVNKKLLIDPIVDVRYLNYKVSILGEVARPSVLTIPSEKVTLLEALGLAGDLTIYASRNNILLIREEEGKKKLVRIDLTSDEIFTSPYYYLKSNDIIYVEPNNTKIQSVSPARQWLPVVFSGLTVIVIAIDRLTR
ncbi:polysaccharide biosynthesis/export family protein [Pontibacter sp. JH31]|uniref:Polysaccharide biosynthesis/export family protein n=1 Tax=Pontibacter aquaedesilientis TaxID=2766980 RepID=A0ABR7XHF2_9BACT|nr:polysaccharide biosynthesis/export family protein [Pontibacter aquaedesilientis]MBD1397707.1 polysaccharide biosynthesis/export family protein [Pontibacter aquaedesilientis]